MPPPARTGRPRADDRRTIEGILYVLITGCRWKDLPREYGAPTTVWRRLKRWGEEGIWEHIWRATLTALDQRGDLDWSIAFLDGSFVPAKKGGEEVGLTRKGKGMKWMLVADGNGLPLGFHLASAACADTLLGPSVPRLSTYPASCLRLASAGPHTISLQVNACCWTRSRRACVLPDSLEMLSMNELPCG